MPTATGRPGSPPAHCQIYALAFGAFLGLALVKFGNPVILDQVIVVPRSLSEVLNDAWPLHWANWVMAVLAAIGGVLAISKPLSWPASRWLWVLPLIWLGWQLLSATQSVDGRLTAITLWQLAGCVACYFIGALVFGNCQSRKLLMIGLLVGFGFCVVRAAQQKIFQFPREREFLREGEHSGWTNVTPDDLQELKNDRIVINTNGIDVANPEILAKYEKGRVFGTLAYPNALAGAVLLLWPMAIVAVFEATRRFRQLTQFAAVGLVVFLGGSALFWSGSKGGWLLALAAGAFWLFRLKWPGRLKWIMVGAVIAVGLVAFGVRFHSYFAKGATSVGARFDYWSVAARTAVEKPVFGTGPGTFQRPYQRLKRPDAEMARLVHNDYLEQFSDSGLVGGLAYLIWIGLTIWTVGRRTWSRTSWLDFATFVGLLAWFAQGLMEFSLYVPALAWTAFTLAGCLVSSSCQTADASGPTTATAGKSVRQSRAH